MDYTISYPFQKEGMRTQVDERKSAWVAFPHRRFSYLLPTVQKSRTLKPVFLEDGSVGVETQEVNTELSKVVNEFIISTSISQDKGKLIIKSMEAYEAFIKVVKALLLVNYDLSNEKIIEVLTMTSSEFSEMYNTIFLHCVGA